MHPEPSKLTSETSPAPNPLKFRVQTASPLLFRRSRRPGPHLLAGGGAAAAASAEQWDSTGGRETQQMHRALRPFLPHVECPSWGQSVPALEHRPESH